MPSGIQRFREAVARALQSTPESRIAKRTMTRREWYRRRHAQRSLRRASRQLQQAVRQMGVSYVEAASRLVAALNPLGHQRRRLLRVLRQIEEQHRHA